MKVGYSDTAGHVKPGIADAAEWIWTDNPETHNDVYCRGRFHEGVRSTSDETGPIRCEDIILPTATQNDETYSGSSSGQSWECTEGVTTMTTVWTDRQYSWTDAPTDFLDGGWTYVRVPMDVPSAAPCSTEGGFEGELNVAATVAICCANHCGSINNPSGVTAKWVPHPGSYAITQVRNLQGWPTLCILAQQFDYKSILPICC